MIMCPLISDRTTWSDGLVKPHKPLGVIDNVPTLLATNPTKIRVVRQTLKIQTSTVLVQNYFEGQTNQRIPTTNFTPNQSQVVQITWVNSEHETKVEEPGVPRPRPQNPPTATKEPTKRTKKRNKGCGISELSQKRMQCLTECNPQENRLK